MTEETKTKIAKGFWIVAALALIWNGLGAMNLVVQLTTDMAAEVAPFPESHMMIIESRPIWATVGFGIAVFGGVLGAGLMLMRRKLAVPVFYISFIAIFLPTFHMITLILGPLTLSMGEVTMMVILPIVVAGILAGYAKAGVARGWLR